MAGWNTPSSFNNGGQPNNPIVGQDRKRVDPTNTYAGIPVQETGHPGIVESDGFYSVDTIDQDVGAEPVASAQARADDIQSRQLRGAKYCQQTSQQRYQVNNPLHPPISYPPQNNHRSTERASGELFPQQSASGFSDRINVPSDGHLSELPPSIPFHQMTQEQTIPICVAPDNLPHSSSTHDSVMHQLGRLLGTNHYAELYKECYSSHIFAGRKRNIARAYATHLLIDKNAVMCRLCFAEGMGFPHRIIHNRSCPLLHCFQRNDNTTSPYQHLSQNGAIREASHNAPRHVSIPRPEHEAFTSEPVEQSLLPNEFYAADSGQPGHARNAHVLNSRLAPPPEVVPPKFKQYADVKARHRTFNNWPRTSKQKPKSLAQAGLFYLDIADHCQCFHCGGILRDWEDEDDPVVEHEKWFPDCPFIQNIIKVRSTEAAVRDTRVQQSRQDVTEAFSSLAIDAQESLNLPDHINPDICAVCRRREIAVTQMYCGHIVCRACLPTADAHGRYLCRVCGGEVMNTAAIDPFCRRSH